MVRGACAKIGHCKAGFYDNGGKEVCNGGGGDCCDRRGCMAREESVVLVEENVQQQWRSLWQQKRMHGKASGRTPYLQIIIWGNNCHMG